MANDQSIETLKGIGEKTAKLFEKVGIRTIDDLLHYYPKGYDTYREPKAIGELSEDETGAVEGFLKSGATGVHINGLSIVQATISDMTGKLRLVWYHMPYLKNTLRPDSHFIFRGRVIRKKNGLTMEQPQMFKPEAYEELLSSMRPVYAQTKGLGNKTITSAVEQALAAHASASTHKTRTDLGHRLLRSRQIGRSFLFLHDADGLRILTFVFVEQRGHGVEFLGRVASIVPRTGGKVRRQILIGKAPAMACEYLVAGNEKLPHGKFGKLVMRVQPHIAFGKHVAARQVGGARGIGIVRAVGCVLGARRTCRIGAVRIGTVRIGDAPIGLVRCAPFARSDPARVVPPGPCRAPATLSSRAAGIPQDACVRRKPHA